MRKAIVIGLGQTGKPLYEILKETYSDVDAIDLESTTLIDNEYEFMNICIPYSDSFIRIVETYQKAFKPKMTIIHSTVPIGTSRKLNALHSPILGSHKNMYSSLKTFIKWIGGYPGFVVKDFFVKAGFTCHLVTTPEETEMLKLICLAKYGMSIAFAQYIQNVCKDNAIDYQDVILWDLMYNIGLKDTGRQEFTRPIISAPDGKIGGHCVIPNTKILNEQYPNLILEEILRYEHDMAAV
jgi:UDP-glucose 6-dehydrogenase